MRRLTGVTRFRLWPSPFRPEIRDSHRSESSQKLLFPIDGGVPAHTPINRTEKAQLVRKRKPPASSFTGNRDRQQHFCVRAEETIS